MLVVDYLILNKDRYGANIEVLRNNKNNTIRSVPLFDHGLSLLFQCTNEVTFTPILNNEEIFNNVKVETGGYGLAWGTKLIISNQQSYKMGESIDLTIADLKCFIKTRVINSEEVSESLNCTRQNVDDLIKRDKLHPIKVNKKNKLFIKSEIEQR